MIGYVTLGSNDLPRAWAFYDVLLGELGAKRTFESKNGVWWGRARGPNIAVLAPHDGAPATVGNGVMVALAMRNVEDVDRLYAKAVSLGATDEGAPGSRGGGFYGAYFRDLDGNKLCVYHVSAA